MGRETMIKKLISAIFFSILLFFSFQFLNDFLFIKTEVTAAKDLALEPKNSIDVFFLGTSHVYCGINPLEIWKQSGITSFDLVTNRQPIWASYVILKQSLKRQKPAVVFFDVLGATDYVEGLIESDRGTHATHLAMDPIPLSLSKIMDVLRIDEIKNKQEMLFPVIYHHRRLLENELNSMDLLYPFTRNRNILKGYVLSFKTEPEERSAPYPIQSIALHPTAKEYLVKIIELCRKENIPLILFKTPAPSSENLLMQLNGIAELAAEFGVPWIDFNRLVDQIHLDYSTDFVDAGHLNVFGAKKVSTYLSQYLKENFHLKDRREDPKYASWNDDALHYDNRLNLQTTTLFSEYLRRLEDPHLIAVITFNQNVMDHREYFLEGMRRCQVESSKVLNFSNGLICVIDTGKAINSTSGHLVHYSDDTIFNITLELSEGTKSSILINQKEQSLNMAGVNIVVFDKDTQTVLDRVAFLPTGELQAVRESSALNP